MKPASNMSPAETPSPAKTSTDKIVSVRQTVEKGEMFRGPIPPPAYMKGYQEIDPTFPDRILKMTEKANDADIEDQHNVIRSDNFSRAFGQVLSFILGCLGLFVAYRLAVLNYASATIITAALTGVAPILIAAIRSNKHD